jgi:aryl-alcohol dehydrogenase-like predicted oxidoreductase
MANQPTRKAARLTAAELSSIIGEAGDLAIGERFDCRDNPEGLRRLRARHGETARPIGTDARGRGDAAVGAAAMNTTREVLPATKLPLAVSAGERLSRLGIGCSRIGSLANPTPMAEIRAMLAHALDLGINVFDTADIYGQGDSERELGRALRKQRNHAFVITKVGKLFSARMEFLSPLKPVIKPLMRVSNAARRSTTSRRSKEMAEDFTPTRLATALDASLKRLGFSHVDGLLLHSPPAEVAGNPRIAAALAAMQAAGKLRHFGVSCDDIAALRAAMTMPGLTLLQLPLDIIGAIAGTNLLAHIADRGVAVFAREVIKGQPALTPSAAVATAMAQPAVTNVLVGVSRRQHLDELAPVAINDILPQPYSVDLPLIATAA